MASFNLFTGIEKLIVEHGSSVVQGRYIDLLKEQVSILKDKFAALEGEKVDLSSKLEIATSEKEKLYAENQDLKKRLAAIDENDEIDDQAYQILEALFNNGPCTELPRLATSFHLSEGEAEYFLDELRDRDFVDKRPVVFGGGGMVPVTACILSAGRAFVMKRRSKKSKTQN